MSAPTLPENGRAPGLLAGFLRGPEVKSRPQSRPMRWLLLPLIVSSAAIAGAHEVLCPSPQRLARLALARRLESRQ